ncbi:hypothetical protein JCM8547_007023 [Rhodosporidiobolus lusitaniae]
MAPSKTNSDKFDQDEGIVADNQVGQQLDGVLSGPDDGFEKPELVDDPDERSNDEFDGIKEDNIIDNGGLLSSVGKRGVSEPEDYGAADRQADETVAQVADEQNEGRSAVAQ